MKCLFCRPGQTRSGRVTVVLKRGKTAEVCENCAGYYRCDGIAGELLERAEKAIQYGAEVDLLKFAA